MHCGPCLSLRYGALELFAALGDRENRRKARLRHVRQRLGDEAFREELGRYFETARQKFAVPQLMLDGSNGGYIRIGRFCSLSPAKYQRMKPNG